MDNRWIYNEALLSSAEMMQSKTLANILSYLFSPTIFAFYVLLILFLFPPLSSTNNNQIFIILFAIILLCVFPIIAILYYFKKGRVDIWVSNQKQRTPFYLVAITGYILASVFFYLQQETTLFVLSVAYVGVTTSVTLSNFITKVSSHSAGVAGPIAALVYIYGLSAVPFFLLLPLVFWSRLKINAHTFTQLTLGAIIGISITLFLYILL
ncbi:MAG: hypothetical protein R6U21_03865, partial [Thermoplasmatota archaeon]